VAPDDKTFDYIAGRPFAPADSDFAAAIRYWRTLKTDDGARFDRDHTLDCSKIAPQVTFGTTQQDVIGVDEHIPDPAIVTDAARRHALENAIRYMGIEPGLPIEGIK